MTNNTICQIQCMVFNESAWSIGSAIQKAEPKYKTKPGNIGLDISVNDFGFYVDTYDPIECEGGFKLLDR